MKKTVQVNLGGQKFTLDEDAYERLSGYLQKIGKLYESSPGKDEILSDIEIRIAELLLERMGDDAGVITLRDVDEVIAVMGNPEDFEQDEDEPSAGRSYSNYRSKGLYRDPDSRIVGGVCSGIGHYFGVDPLWIRLAFALSFVVFGTGVLFYIILWIIMPEARTTAEKLSMKGEPVNIDSIGKSIEEEINNLGSRVSQAGSDFSKGTGRKIERGIDRFFNFLAELFRGFFTVLGKIIGVMFVLLGLSMVVVMLAGILGIADLIHLSAVDWESSMNIYEWGDVVFNSSEWLLLAVLGLILVIVVPFIGLAYGGIILLVPNLRVPFLGASLGGLWFIGLVLAVMTGFGVAQEFSKTETLSDQIPLSEMGLKSDTIEVTVGDDPFNISTKRAYYARNDFMMKVDDRRIIVGNVEFDVRLSKGAPKLEIERSARASSFEEATRRADSIRYQFKVDSNVLSLNPYFSYPQIQLLRSQEVKTTLLVPVGTVVYLREDVKRIMEDIDNVQDMYDPYMVNHHWLMTPEGLDCLDCAEEELEEDQDETEIILDALRDSDDVKINVEISNN